MRGFIKLFSESINFFSQPGYMYYKNKNLKIKIVAMKEKIMNLKVSMDLMFAYLDKYDYYDQLLKNDRNDKYIISIVYSGKKEENVDVFRLLEIKDPELQDRVSLLDEGYPLVNTCDNETYIFSYLSEVKVLTESVGESVKELLKNM
jgi:hypothetical protein